jgi:hypothetical protein
MLHTPTTPPRGGVLSQDGRTPSGTVALQHLQDPGAGGSSTAVHQQVLSALSHCPLVWGSAWKGAAPPVRRESSPFPIISRLASEAGKMQWKWHCMTVKPGSEDTQQLLHWSWRTHPLQTHLPMALPAVLSCLTVAGRSHL